MGCGFGVEAHAGWKKLVRRGGREFFVARNCCTARIPPQSPFPSPNHHALLYFRGVENADHGWISTDEFV
jgi:hypothetical protein